MIIMNKDKQTKNVVEYERDRNTNRKWNTLNDPEKFR